MPYAQEGQMGPGGKAQARGSLAQILQAKTDRELGIVHTNIINDFGASVDEGNFSEGSMIYTILAYREMMQSRLDLLLEEVPTAHMIFRVGEDIYCSRGICLSNLPVSASPLHLMLEKQHGPLVNVTPLRNHIRMLDEIMDSGKVGLNSPLFIEIPRTHIKGDGKAPDGPCMSLLLKIDVKEQRALVSVFITPILDGFYNFKAGIAPMYDILE